MTLYFFSGILQTEAFYMSHLLGFRDTIVALATPPGVGAIGIVRLSGEKSINIANQLFPSTNLHEVPSHTLHYGNIVWEQKNIDEVLVSVFKAPKSYTGEDIIEISCHGSSFVLNQVIQLSIQCGARLAKAGEFTQRAFLNGKMDLTQAEGVADLIASDTRASHRAAIQNMKGGFSKILQEVRGQLIQFAALIELELDFSQEDVEFADREKLYILVEEITQIISALSESFKLGNVIKNGVNTVIAGKPNAGKSTLLNALLNENRAIVSEIAGTTRDTIEEVLNINGILFRLIDTAGLRDKSADYIEMAGISRTMEKIKQAGVVIYLFDVNDTTDEELAEAIKLFQKLGTSILLVGNKIDEDPEMKYLKQFNYLPDPVYIAAKKKFQLNKLEHELVRLAIGSELNLENVIVTNVRHYNNLQLILKSLRDIKIGMDKKLPGDLLALDIRQCLFYLGELTGEITTEDKLDYIFSKFCIGK
jgi:tRNA modification GTPase